MKQRKKAVTHNNQKVKNWVQHGQLTGPSCAKPENHKRTEQGQTVSNQQAAGTPSVQKQPGKSHKK